MNNKEIEFLRESNAIEREYSKQALDDAKQAWMMAKLASSDPIDIHYICGIHRRLLKRLNPKIAGKIRECPVMIGGDVRNQPKEEIILQLNELCKNWEENKDILKNKRKQDKEEFIKRWHILFENCHGFRDGNGRTGRILMNIQRLKMGLPLLIIHEGKEQQSYYLWFKEQDE